MRFGGGNRVSQGVVAKVVGELGRTVVRKGIRVKEIVAFGEAVVPLVAEHQGAALRFFLQVFLGQEVPYCYRAVGQVFHEFLFDGAVFRKHVVDGADGITFPQRHVVTHIYFAAFYLHLAFYLGAVIANVMEVVPDAVDAFFHQGGIVDYGRHTHALHESAHFGFAVPAPVVHGQERVDAQQVRIGLLGNVGHEAGGVEGGIVHLYLVFPEEVFSVFERTGDAAGACPKRTNAKKYDFPPFHPYKSNTFYLYLRDFLIQFTEG